MKSDENHSHKITSSTTKPTSSKLAQPTNDTNNDSSPASSKLQTDQPASSIPANMNQARNKPDPSQTTLQKGQIRPKKYFPMKNIDLCSISNLLTSVRSKLQHLYRVRHVLGSHYSLGARRDKRTCINIHEKD